MYTDLPVASRSSTALKICGILLLALAVSPVTAPFSTCDLLDLFGSPVPGGEAMLKPHAPTHEPVASPGVTSEPAGFQHSPPSGSRSPRPSCERPRVTRLPLRL